MAGHYMFIETRGLHAVLLNARLNTISEFFTYKTFTVDKCPSLT